MDFSDYYQEALSEPMKWVRLDTDFLNDPKVQRLAVVGGGWEAVGKYVGLITRLGIADGRSYDLSDELGWRFLAAAMVCGGTIMDGDELRGFVSTLYDLKLIDRDMWDESRKLAMPRLMREAEKMAKDVAMARAKADKMVAARQK